jgi:hypothetical protein
MWRLNLACYSEEQFYTDLVLQHSRLGLSIGALVVLQFFNNCRTGTRASPPWAASRNGKLLWPRLRGWSAGALQSRWDSAQIYGLQSCLVCISCFCTFWTQSTAQRGAKFHGMSSPSVLSLRLAQVHHFQVHGECNCESFNGWGRAQLAPFMTGKAMQLLESMPARQVVPNAFIMGAAAAACREAKGCTVTMVVSHTPMRQYTFVDTNVIKCVYNNPLPGPQVPPTPPHVP